MTSKQYANLRHPVLCVLLAWLLMICFAAADVFTIGYLTNIHGRENPHRQGLAISGAISYALDVVNNNSSFLKGHRLNMIYNDTEGDTLIGTNVTIQQWRTGAIAFFGPEDSCEVEATVAASLNLPMISYVSTPHLSFIYKFKIMLNLFNSLFTISGLLRYCNGGSHGDL